MQYEKKEGSGYWVLSLEAKTKKVGNPKYKRVRSTVQWTVSVSPSRQQNIEILLHLSLPGHHLTLITTSIVKSRAGGGVDKTSRIIIFDN